jgi:GxxExxY protein
MSRKSLEGQMTENHLSHQIIGAAIEVHRELGGPGLLECVYEEALAFELKRAGFDVQRQKSIPVVYKGFEIRSPLCLDLLVENKVVIEVKAVEKFNPLYASQLLTYLRLGSYRLGLVANFGATYLKNGIHRVVNRCPEN